MKKRLEYEFFNCPGLYWSDEELQRYVEGFRALALNCLKEIPNYQCLSFDRNFLKRALIVTVRDKLNNELLGFCSAVLFEMNFDQSVLHLGLTCVSPSARGLKLTHKLTSRVLKGYFLEISLFKTLWVSNVACVLSSLGNVAKCFESVYPSPYELKPSELHKKIATKINLKYREDFYVSPKVKFNESTFVFEGSVSGNSFEKSKYDKRFFHREKHLNDFYMERINFERGDEVLQIGKVNLLTFIKYFFKQISRKIKKNKFIGNRNDTAIA